VTEFEWTCTWFEPLPFVECDQPVTMLVNDGEDETGFCAFHWQVEKVRRERDGERSTWRPIGDE